jgi:hypothetical protein
MKSFSSRRGRTAFGPGFVVETSRPMRTDAVSVLFTTEPETLIAARVAALVADGQRAVASPSRSRRPFRAV